MSSLLIVPININFKRFLKSIIDNSQIMGLCQMMDLRYYNIRKRSEFYMDCLGCDGSI